MLHRKAARVREQIEAAQLDSTNTIVVQIMFLARRDDFSRLGGGTAEVVTTNSKSFSEKL
jgi:hypothetical protein